MFQRFCRLVSVLKGVDGPTRLLCVMLSRGGGGGGQSNIKKMGVLVVSL